MLMILITKFVLNIVYTDTSADFQGEPSKVQFYVNISLELVFNSLLIYY